MRPAGEQTPLAAARDWAAQGARSSSASPLPPGRAPGCAVPRFVCPQAVRAGGGGGAAGRAAQLLPRQRGASQPAAARSLVPAEEAPLNRRRKGRRSGSGPKEGPEKRLRSLPEKQQQRLARRREAGLAFGARPRRVRFRLSPPPCLPCRACSLTQGLPARACRRRSKGTWRLMMIRRRLERKGSQARSLDWCDFPKRPSLQGWHHFCWGERGWGWGNSLTENCQVERILSTCSKRGWGTAKVKFFHSIDFHERFLHSHSFKVTALNVYRGVNPIVGLTFVSEDAHLSEQKFY